MASGEENSYSSLTELWLFEPLPDDEDEEEEEAAFVNRVILLEVFNFNSIVSQV